MIDSYDPIFELTMPQLSNFYTLSQTNVLCMFIHYFLPYLLYIGK